MPRKVAAESLENNVLRFEYLCPVPEGGGGGVKKVCIKTLLFANGGCIFAYTNRHIMQFFMCSATFNNIITEAILFFLFFN